MKRGGQGKSLGRDRLMVLTDFSLGPPPLLPSGGRAAAHPPAAWPLLEGPDEITLKEYRLTLERSPSYSLIVNLDEECKLVSVIFFLQRNLDRRFEIIVACRERVVGERVAQILDTRMRSYNILMRLVYPTNTSVDRSGARNMAINVVRTEIVFFQDSGVLVTNIGALLDAGALLSRGANKVVGFSLLFEDDTIYHVGIDFLPSSLPGSEFVMKYRLRGKPIDWRRLAGDPKPRVVTGALMGIRRSTLLQLGGFHSIFGHSDFEDADLCLRARESGVDVVTLMRPGLYHLCGRLLVRGTYDHYASDRFYSRWAAALSSHVRVIRGK